MKSIVFFFHSPIILENKQKKCLYFCRNELKKCSTHCSDGNNNSVASWIVTLLIVLAGICAFGLGIVAVLVKDTNSEALDSSTEL